MESKKATSAKAVLALVLSKYKQRLDKHVVLLQLSEMVDEEETCQSLFSLSLFHCLQKESKSERYVYSLLSGQPSLKANLGVVMTLSLFLRRKFDLGGLPTEIFKLRLRNSNLQA